MVLPTVLPFIRSVSYQRNQVPKPKLNTEPSRLQNGSCNCSLHWVKEEDPASSISSSPRKRRKVRLHTFLLVMSNSIKHSIYQNGMIRGSAAKLLVAMDIPLLLVGSVDLLFVSTKTVSRNFTQCNVHH
ncbi:hypothetical protein PR048_026569, partial [Dryococelus australis]